MRNLKVTVNGTVYDVQVEEVDAASAPAQPAAAAAQKPAAAPAAPAPTEQKPAVPKAAPPAGGETITSPMPGTIVDICVEPGREVKKGDKLVVLEAMKMENEIMAPHDAKVAAVMVDKGDSVETGAPLVSLL